MLADPLTCLVAILLLVEEVEEEGVVLPQLLVVGASSQMDGLSICRPHHQLQLPDRMVVQL